MSTSKQAATPKEIETSIMEANKRLIIIDYQRDFGVSKECATKIADVGIKVYYAAKDTLTVESLKNIADSIKGVTLMSLKEAKKGHEILAHVISSRMQMFYHDGDAKYQEIHKTSNTKGRAGLFISTCAKASAEACYEYKNPPSQNISEPAGTAGPSNAGKKK